MSIDFGLLTEAMVVLEKALAIVDEAPAA